MRPFRTRACLLCCVVLLAVGALGCRASEPPRGRVLIVGIDGATLDVIDPLMREGRLPNLAALADAGVSGALRSLNVMLSPRVWTTVATGREPSEHGVEGWIDTHAVGPGMRMYDSHDRRVHALWNHFERGGRRVATVNWLMTYPPEPVDGVMVSDALYPEEVVNRRKLSSDYAKAAGGSLRAPDLDRAAPVWPATWEVRALAAGDREPLVPAPRPFAGFEGELAGLRILDGNFTRDAGLVAVALEIEDEVRPDLLMILVQGIDRISHFAYGALQDESAWPAAALETPEGSRLLRDGLLDFYGYTDALIGLLVGRYGEDDLVMVLSDHGFEPSDSFPLGTHVSDTARDGVLFARGRGIPAGVRTEPLDVVDVAPTVLAWAGLPVADDMPGRVAGFLDVAPARIPTWEDQPIPRLERTRSVREAERIEELRALGYVE